MAIRIAITGTLSGIKRREAVEMIESVGANFSSEVNYKTNYLVATRLDSGKAKRAREINVQVITELEFLECIEAGEFPENNLPDKPERKYTNNFVEPDWVGLPADKQRPLSFEYCSVDGEITDRKVVPLALGTASLKSGNMRRYLKAEDIDDNMRPKTFRFDRIISDLTL